MALPLQAGIGSNELWQTLRRKVGRVRVDLKNEINKLLCRHSVSQDPRSPGYVNGDSLQAKLEQNPQIERSKARPPFSNSLAMANLFNFINSLFH